MENQQMVMTGWVCDGRTSARLVTFKTFEATIHSDVPESTFDTMWLDLDREEGIHPETVAMWKAHWDLNLPIPMDADPCVAIYFIIDKIRIT
jgi:hypothetical protein